MTPYQSRRLQTALLLLFFVFCQVIGTMCVIPDVVIASEGTALVKDSMACPMEGGTMCPPSLASSPERQLKGGATIDLSDTLIVLSSVAVLKVPSVSTLWAWSNVLSIVPISIAASSVLRI